MRKWVMTAAAAAALTMAGASAAEAGCYRLGLSGYHWYRSSIGPPIMYPHHRSCEWRHGHRVCWVH